jgi:DNA-binding IclR family transcriptional regulator
MDEMLRLFDLDDVNVTINVASGLEVSYLRVLESRHSMGGAQRPGMRDPIHCSASGKVLMAFHPEKLLESMLKGYKFEKLTERTVTDMDAFKKRLEFVRGNGFVKNERAEYDHILGISAPIFNYLGEPNAALDLWSVYPRHTIDDLAEWSDELKKSAQHITGMIGGIESNPASADAN